MPSSTDSARLTNVDAGATYPTDVAAMTVPTAKSTNAHPSLPHLRPKSAKSARSTSPLLSRWGRNGGKENRSSPQNQQLRQPEYGGNQLSGRKSSSTGGGIMKVPPTTKGNRERDSQTGLPPELTREEFEALPVAIQRKGSSISTVASSHKSAESAVGQFGDIGFT